MQGRNVRLGRHGRTVALLAAMPLFLQAVSLAASAAVVLQDTVRPVANAGPDNSYPVGTRVRFDGSLSADNVGVVSYTWSFLYDGTQVQLLGRVVNFTFNEPGIRVYNVTLTVRDAVGNSDMDWMRLTIFPSARDADSDGLPDEWEMQYFLDLTEDAGGDPDEDGFTNLQEYDRGTDPTVPDEPPGFFEVYFWPIVGLGGLAIAALFVGRWAFARGHVRGKEEQRVRSAIEDEIEEVLEEEGETPPGSGGR